MSKQVAWEPLSVVDDDIVVDGIGVVLITIHDGRHITMRHVDSSKPFLAWELKENIAICRATHTDSPDMASVPLDIGTEALNMLRWVVEAYHPQWHYEMGKTGYECAFCKSMFGTSKGFMDTSDHSIGCQWAQAKAWLSTITQEGE